MVTTSAIEKPKRTKSRTGCKMCKRKRLKCDESKPACNQCVRRGRLCPVYRREIKWSTMITAKDGKTRPLPEEEYQNEETQIVQSEDLAATSVSLPQNVSISGSSTHSGAGEQDRNFEDSGNGYTDLILDAEGWAHAPKVLETGMVWTEWTGEVDHLASSADDVNRFETIDDMCTDLATIDYIFPGSPIIPVRQARRPSLPSPNPVDLPTFLITHWFTNVCSMWCAYDSPQN